MADDTTRPVDGDLADMLTRLRTRASMAEMLAVDTTTSSSIGAAGASGHGAAVDYAAGVIWSARDLITIWDDARILGLACQSGAGAAAVLAAVQALRAALARTPA